MSLRGSMGVWGAAALVVGLALGQGVLSGCERDGFCVNCNSDGLDGGGLGDGDNVDFGDNPLEDAGSGVVTLPDGAIATPDICVPRETGEVCNGLDDDCDKLTDEGFDLDNDPQHCGACNTPCRADNADATCVAGSCEIGDCLDGFADLDDDVGCEYRCPVFPGKAEDCNGLDDDCDGVVDETLKAPPAGLCRTTAGTPCAGTQASCETVEGVTTWFCQYGAGVEFDPIVPNGIALQETSCDGLDGDCDGQADDPWPVGDPCDDGGFGVCRDLGELVCDPGDDTAVICDLSVLPDGEAPQTEVCNDLDDNCDGMVDNGIVDDMVHIAGGGDFYIFRHEASHPDASDSEQGLSSGRACSKPGVLPWTYVTFEQAQAACTAAGKRLCTGAEWQAACGNLNYPYAQTYDSATCNGADYGFAVGNSPSEMLATDSLAACVSQGGVSDLSGNVKEWTNDPRGTTPGGVPIHVVRGGSYLSPALGLTCQTTLSQAAATPGQATIGFRCCSDDAP